MSHPDTFSLRRDFLLGKASAPIYALKDAAALSRCACAVAIGAFDGVHRGHRHLIDQMIVDAHGRGVAAIAVTFDPDPDIVVSATHAPKLTLVADRLRLLASSGVDAVCVVPFDSALASMDLSLIHICCPTMSPSAVRMSTRTVSAVVTRLVPVRVSAACTIP